jgi:hypothetical protein
MSPAASGALPSRAHGHPCLPFIFRPSGDVPAHSCVSAPKSAGGIRDCCVRRQHPRLVHEPERLSTYDEERLEAGEVALKLAVHDAGVDGDEDDAVIRVAARERVAQQDVC